MAVINDQDPSRTRAFATRTGSTGRVTARGPRHPLLRHVGGNAEGRNADGRNAVGRDTVGRDTVGRDTVGRSTNVDALAAGPAALPGVTHLRARPTAAEPEQLPLAVGFGSTGDVSPCRLWVVPGLPGDRASLPALLDDGWPDEGWSSSTGRVADVEPTRIPRAGRLAIDSGAAESGARLQSSTVRRESAPLHLTARGRVVLLLLAAVVGMAVVVLAWFGAGSSATPVQATQPARITVHDGDTLWSIAGKVAPNRDPRAVVAHLLQLNHLRTPDLVPGQVLLTR